MARPPRICLHGRLLAPTRAGRIDCAASVVLGRWRTSAKRIDGAPSLLQDAPGSAGKPAERGPQLVESPTPQENARFLRSRNLGGGRHDRGGEHEQDNGDNKA